MAGWAQASRRLAIQDTGENSLIPGQGNGAITIINGEKMKFLTYITQIARSVLSLGENHGYPLSSRFGSGTTSGTGGGGIPYGAMQTNMNRDAQLRAVGYGNGVHLGPSRGTIPTRQSNGIIAAGNDGSRRIRRMERYTRALQLQGYFNELTDRGLDVSAPINPALTVGSWRAPMSAPNAGDPRLGYKIASKNGIK